MNSHKPLKGCTVWLAGEGTIAARNRRETVFHLGATIIMHRGNPSIAISGADIVVIPDAWLRRRLTGQEVAAIRVAQNQSKPVMALSDLKDRVKASENIMEVCQRHQVTLNPSTGLLERKQRMKPKQRHADALAIMAATTPSLGF